MTEGRDRDADEQASDSLLNRSALAAGALAAGLTGGNVVAGSTDAGQRAEGLGQDDGDDFRAEALVFTCDFHPAVPFTVLDRIQTSTVVEILSGPSGEGVPVITHPEDYNGYVVNYRLQRGGPGEFTLVFTEAMLEPGERYQFGMDSQVLSTRFRRSAPIGASPRSRRPAC
jgi:hypothetical protein